MGSCMGYLHEQPMTVNDMAVVAFLHGATI